MPPDTHRTPDPLLLIAFAAALVLAALGLDVALGGPLTSREAFVPGAWHTGTWPRIDLAALAISRTGGPSAVSFYAAAAVAVYAAHRRFAAAVLIGSMLWGSALLNVALKMLVHRSRPSLADPIVVLHTWSFPSGHAVASVTFAGIACLVLWRSTPEPTTRALVALALLGWAALVCASRVWLGAHYPVDVAGGAAAATVWIASGARIAMRRRVDLAWPRRLASR